MYSHIPTCMSIDDVAYLFIYFLIKFMIQKHRPDNKMYYQEEDICPATNMRNKQIAYKTKQKDVSIWITCPAWNQRQRHGF